MEKNYNEILEKVKDKNWKKIDIIFNINAESIGYDKIEFIDDNDAVNSFWIDFIDINELRNLIINEYNQNIKDVSKRFNKYQIEFYFNGEVIEKKWWDSGKVKQDLLGGAEVFYQWVNYRMMSMIFEYEQANNLVPTRIDDDDELEYLSSWDSGVFTFRIVDDKLTSKIELTKDGVTRIIDFPFKDYFITGMLEHHKTTHNELKDEWKPWNTMVLKSLHYDIPYDKREEYVSYRLD